MKSTKPFAILITLIYAMTLSMASAQETFRAMYDTHYSFQKKKSEIISKNSDNKAPRSTPFALELSADKSYFYNYAHMIEDSTAHAVYMETKDEVRAMETRIKVKAKGEQMMVESLFAELKRKTGHKISGDLFFYDEELTRPKWTIDESVTETKSGYPCHRATAKYLGREWTVWYTPEIPTSAGPWKLWGLPGLMVEATEAEGLFAFSLSSFEQLKPEDRREDCRKYLLVGDAKEGRRKDIHKLLQLYHADPATYLNMIYPGGTLVLKDTEGKTLTPEEVRNKFVNIER